MKKTQMSQINNNIFSYNTIFSYINAFFKFKMYSPSTLEFNTTNLVCDIQGTNTRERTMLLYKINTHPETSRHPPAKIYLI